MPYDPSKHHRRSIRLRGYDYTQLGSYAVTICTQDRAPILGNLNNFSVTLSPIGHIIEQCWIALPYHFPHITLDVHIVMPDHFHGIITINVPMAKGIASATQVSSNGTTPNSLAAIVQNFKSVSTRRVNQMQHTIGSTLWQRNYYEHVIRSEEELVRIRQYILGNPAQSVEFER
ncbi:transposase [Candidatus Oscillochloris fontis]|uniref:transposase n=1 Tax=Candidatus Oscillochloris fontis TaxID=2496868 RepID=UPI00101B6254|nr:transposase [Candidatus Oscillochloris fontis]